MQLQSYALMINMFNCLFTIENQHSFSWGIGTQFVECVK